MLEERAIKVLKSGIKAHRKSVFVIFEALWLLFHWVVEPFVPASMALAAPPIVAVIISLMMLPLVSQIYSFAKEKGLLEEKAFGIVLYVTCYLLTLYLTIMLLQIFVRVFDINSIELVQFLLQTVAFFLFIAVFCVFRNPKQLQYLAYAIGYGLFMVWEWAVNWEVLGDSLLGIDIKFSLTFFTIPYKEAMLLFIILDTYFKAKEE